MILTIMWPIYCKFSIADLFLAFSRLLENPFKRDMLLSLLVLLLLCILINRTFLTGNLVVLHLIMLNGGKKATQKEKGNRPYLKTRHLHLNSNTEHPLPTLVLASHLVPLHHKGWP